MLCKSVMHVHVPRTGGSTIRAFLPSIGGGIVVSDPHLPYSNMAARCKEPPPSFALIRNPWSWYVSQWCWIQHIGQGGFKGSPFVDFMQYVMENTASEPVDLLNFTSLTNAWKYLEADKVDYIGHFENFRGELGRILMAILPNLAEDTFLNLLAKAGRRRQAPRPDGKAHGDYRQYYNGEIREWVEKADADLLRRFGYDF